MGHDMSQDVPTMFMMPMTFATEEFEEFVTVLNTYLEQIKVQGLTERKAKIEMMCAFYTSLLARMTAAIKTTTFQYSEKKHYKYDLRACKKAHEELMTTDAYKEYEDQRIFKPAWGHLDGYVWGILSKCYHLLMDVHIHTKDMDVFLENFKNFINQRTIQLNETKEDMKYYIETIEGRSRYPRLDDLGDLWKLQTLITFTEGEKPVVWQRNWFIQPFAFALPTSGGPVEGGHYATFSKKHAHVTCDKIGGLLTRLENL